VDYLLLVTATSITSACCAAVYATAKIVALKIVLKDCRPQDRAPLVRAVAELFRPAPLAARTAAASRLAGRRRSAAESTAEPG
jgi:hypothetical protein